MKGPGSRAATDHAKYHPAMLACSGRRSAALLALVFPVASCTTDVPVGFGSGTTLQSRDVIAEAAQVVDAARLALYELGDAVETSQDGPNTVLRTGRSRIVVHDLGSGVTRLEVYMAQYVGPDHRQRAESLLQQVVDHLR